MAKNCNHSNNMGNSENAYESKKNGYQRQKCVYKKHSWKKCIRQKRIQEPDDRQLQLQ